MAIITTPAAGVSPYQEAAATPVVLKADANGNTVLANPTVTATAADTAATTAANANSTVIVNGQAALNQLIASSRSGVFEGANVTINLEEQNFNTTNQVTSNTNYPSGGTGEIQYNSGSNSFASSAYFTYTNGNVITPGIRTDGYYYANGAAFSGGGGNADLGNWAFTANTQYNLNGGSINNSDLSHGSTAGLVIPANGNSVTPVQLINTYGNITLGTGPSSVITKTWTFASNGNTAMPGNISALGNVTGANVITSGLVSVGGNVTGNYFIGNGSQLTGISSSIISNGTSNVSIATSGGPVSVKAGSANAWVFGTDAVLTAPNGSQIVPAGNNFNIYTNGVNGAVQFFTDVTGNNHNWAFDGYGYTNLPFSQGYSNTAVITTVGAGNIMLQAGAGPTQNFVFDTAGNVTMPNGGYINFVNTGGITQAVNENLIFTVSDDEQDGWAVTSIVNDGAGTDLTRMQVRYDGIRINTDLPTNNYSWDFRDSGEFDVPKSIRGPVGGNLVISIGDQPSSNTFIDLQTRSYVGDALISNVRIANPNVTISTSSGTQTWTFDDTGKLNLPGGTGYMSSSANTITIYSDTAEVNGMLFYDGGAEVYASNDFAIFADNANNGNTWRFYGNAVLSLPGEGIIQSLNDTVILQSKNTSTGNIYSARLGTTGGVYLESTEYANGWMYITNNSGNADIDSPSGNINIKPAFGVANGNGKSLNLRGGDADQSDFYTGAGGNINITGGLGAFNDGGGGGPGGDVNISAGLSADPAGVAGNVRINSGSQTWQFINNGNLYVPGQINGDNNGNLVIDGAGYGNGYISLPASSFGGEQVAIVNDFGLGNGIALTTTGGTWHFNNSGNLTLPYGGVIIQTPVSYANLTATAGARAFISDANLAAAGNFGQQVIGGASNTVPVWSDGTNWYIG